MNSIILASTFNVSSLELFVSISKYYTDLIKFSKKKSKRKLEWKSDQRRTKGERQKF